VIETSARPEAATVREAMLHVARGLAAARRWNGEDRACGSEIIDHFCRAASTAPAGAEAVLALAASGTSPALKLPALVSLSELRQVPATERMATLALVLVDDPNDLTARFALSVLRRIAERRAPAPVVALIVGWAHARWPRDASDLVGDASLRVGSPANSRIPGCGLGSPLPSNVRDEVIALAATLDAGVLARLTPPVRPENGTLPEDAHARFVLGCCADAAAQADAAVARVLLDWFLPQLAGRADTTQLAAWDKVALGVLGTLLERVPDELLPRFSPLHLDAACSAYFSHVALGPTGGWAAGPTGPRSPPRADRWSRVPRPAAALRAAAPSR
jgi:hypothetical protein